MKEAEIDVEAGRGSMDGLAGETTGWELKGGQSGWRGEWVDRGRRDMARRVSPVWTRDVQNGDGPSEV